MVLFAPFGLFAVLATRRPFFSAAVGILFTAVVETGQATMPFITRLCDTDDLVTNTVGVLAGAAVGAVICRRAECGTPLARVVVRRSAIAGTAISLLVAQPGPRRLNPCAPSCRRRVLPQLPSRSRHSTRSSRKFLGARTPSTRRTSSTTLTAPRLSAPPYQAASLN
ncbi:VanZ family protein [Streptomyces sp. LMG1-1-1.1]|uniref:VanZ family protein n=1 Tax=Streptomyces sp. LMG1-1-1.1 TaxID=3135245 RepID=UPI00346721FF